MIVTQHNELKGKQNWLKFEVVLDLSAVPTTQNLVDSMALMLSLDVEGRASAWSTRHLLKDWKNSKNGPRVAIFKISETTYDIHVPLCRRAPLNFSGAFRDFRSLQFVITICDMIEVYFSAEKNSAKDSSKKKIEFLPSSTDEARSFWDADETKSSSLDFLTTVLLDSENKSDSINDKDVQLFDF